MQFSTPNMKRDDRSNEPHRRNDNDHLRNYGNSAASLTWHPVPFSEQRLVPPPIVTHLDERKPAAKSTLRSQHALNTPTCNPGEWNANRRHSLSQDPYMPSFRSPRMDAMLSFEEDDQFPVATSDDLDDFEDCVEGFNGHPVALPPSAFQHIFTPPDNSTPDTKKSPVYPNQLNFTTFTYPTPSQHLQNIAYTQGYAHSPSPASRPSLGRYQDKSDSSYTESPEMLRSHYHTRPRGKVPKRPAAPFQEIQPPRKVARATNITARPTLPYPIEKREPTEEELEEAKSPRGKEALRTWYARYNELLDYWSEHGHCLVPQKYPPNEKLGVWVNKQRMEKKLRDEGHRSSLTDRKLALLQDIDFQWAKRKGDHSWNEKYDELCAYKRAHNDDDPPTKFKRNPALGRWVSTQRSQYKEYMLGKATHLTDARVQLLENVGFQWTKLEESGPEVDQPPRRRSHRHS